MFEVFAILGSLVVAGLGVFLIAGGIVAMFMAYSLAGRMTRSDFLTAVFFICIGIGALRIGMEPFHLTFEVKQ